MGGCYLEWVKEGGKSGGGGEDTGVQLVGCDSVPNSHIHRELTRSTKHTHINSYTLLLKTQDLFNFSLPLVPGNELPPL